MLMALEGGEGTLDSVIARCCPFSSRKPHRAAYREIAAGEAGITKRCRLVRGYACGPNTIRVERNLSRAVLIHDPG
jgi:hypothetical protein